MSVRIPREANPSDRLIVALDVPSPEAALELVNELEGVVSFYKVGLELLMTGGMETLLRRLAHGKRLFVDLKLPNDIPETVRRVVDLAAEIGVTFLTLSNGVTPMTIQSAVEGRGDRPGPKLLFVPLLSSMDCSDLVGLHGGPAPSLEEFLERTSAHARTAGADGFIVSGPEIALLRRLHPDAVLVSPGIRPAGSPSDDHKRSCTPAEAIRLGADYIVVGRPIRNAPDRKVAARNIIAQLT